MNSEKDIEIKQKKKRKHHRGRRKKKTWKDKLINCCFVLAVCVFLFSGFKLWKIFSEYKKGTDTYKNIENEVVEEQTVPLEIIDEESGESVYTKGQRTALKIDFDALKKKNKDIVGWIYFENPSISYPIVDGVDNSIYLKRTFEGKYNSAGTLFVEMNNEMHFSDKNTIIYGHNMKSGSMFGQLKKFKSLEFRNENPYFYIYTPDGKEFTYEIFATCVVDAASNSYDISFTDNDEFLAYIDQELDCSLYNSSVDINEDDSIVTLSTCTGRTTAERLVVHGVRISERIVE